MIRFGDAVARQLLLGIIYFQGAEGPQLTRTTCLPKKLTRLPRICNGATTPLSQLTLFKFLDLSPHLQGHWSIHKLLGTLLSNRVINTKGIRCDLHQFLVAILVFQGHIIQKTLLILIIGCQ